MFSRKYEGSRRELTFFCENMRTRSRSLHFFVEKPEDSGHESSYLSDNMNTCAESRRLLFVMDYIRGQET